MDNTTDKVRSLWIPLRGINLLLPNVAVAEISSYRMPVQLADKPNWLLGMVKWRNREIPVISIEEVCGVELKSNPVFSKLMILNSVREGSSISNYAIVTAGLPSLMQFGADTADQTEICRDDGLKCIVRVGDEEAIIPDLDYLQKMLEGAFEQAA